jgi:membrane protease YdiL (CAAX protease family)
MTIRERIRLPPRSRTVLVALALTLAGSTAGLLGAMLPGSFGLVTATTPDAIYVVSSRGVQFGFGAFAVGYVAYTGEWSRYARFRRPEPRDAVAVVGAFLAVVAVGAATDALISTLGLSSEPVTGTVDHDFVWYARPALWPLVLVAWFAFAAPAEELFYRGLVQTRLQAYFSAGTVVVLSGGCFALSHALFSVLSGTGGAAVATTFVELFGAGLVFGGLYEFSDDLVPVATFHALTWLEPIHAIERALVAVP